MRTIEDVNGEGMGDLVAFGEDGVYVSLSNGSGFDPNYIAIASFSWQDDWRVGTHPRFVADIDGDGRKDVLGYPTPRSLKM